MSSSFSTPELPAVGIMKHLTDEERLLLSSYGEFLPVQEGVTVVEENSMQDSLFFVISGLLEAVTKKDDNEVLLGTISAGQSVGEVSMFDPIDASATVRAAEFAQVWKIDLPTLQEYMGQSPQGAATLLIGISEYLSKRLRQTNEKLKYSASYLD